MDWNPIGAKIPKQGVDVLLRSHKEQYYIGTYYSEARIFRVISQYKLQEDGSILALTTGFHETYFTHWIEITLPAAVTTVTAKQRCSCDIHSDSPSNRHQTFCALYRTAHRPTMPPWDPYPDG